MISLAERSYRENKTFVFDPKTRKATAVGNASSSAISRGGNGSGAPNHGGGKTAPKGANGKTIGRR